MIISGRCIEKGIREMGRDIKSVLKVLDLISSKSLMICVYSLLTVLFVSLLHSFLHSFKSVCLKARFKE